MQGTRDRPEFTPPPEPGLPRSIGLALLAHAVLLLGLSWGLKWQRDDQNAVVEAELWSNTVQQAAPREVAPPPPPPPPPAPPQQVQRPPAPPAPQEREAEIALEQEKKRQALEKARQEEAERQKLAAQKKREEEAARKLAEAKQAEAKRAEERKKEEQAKLRQRQEEERLAKLREDNMKRMQGLAGATGVREATGSATSSSGPSATYAGRLAALFQRNVVFPGGVDTIAGNPEAEVQVKVSPTGTILNVRLARSSGNPSWDEAAVRAIERSERIPPDENGRYVLDFPVKMRPKR
jgi:colicin import membrane protein